MQLEFGYGNGVQTVELPQENLLGVLHALGWVLRDLRGSNPRVSLLLPGPTR